MRISDWSSDVCSSDLLVFAHLDPGIYTDPEGVHDACRGLSTQMAAHMRDEAPVEPAHPETARIGRPDEIFRERVASGPWMVESLQHQISIHWRQGRRWPGAVAPGRLRSEERRVGKEGVSTGRSRWWAES